MTAGVVTVGSLRKADAIVGLLDCMGNTNEETIANMRRHLTTISAPCVVTEDAVVTESRDAAAFLARDAT